jgi:hypothetical protein
VLRNRPRLAAFARQGAQQRLGQTASCRLPEKELRSTLVLQQLRNIVSMMSFSCFLPSGSLRVMWQLLLKRSSSVQSLGLYCEF